MAEFRLADTKYAETEYLIKTIDMAKSDEEYDLDDRCATPPSTSVDFEFVQDASDPSIYARKVVKRQPRPSRRHTMSHSGPPAPPSTPTSLTASGASTPSPTASGSTVIDNEGLSKFVYILDYAPKYKKKLKEQQRTDAELAELFSVVTITGGGNVSSTTAKSGKLSAERGISSTSRTIRKHDSNTKIFKIHRNSKDFLREPDEDSVSAPEYDGEEEDVRYRRFSHIRPCRRFLPNRRERRLARFMNQERMDEIGDIFKAAINFNDV